MNLLIVNFHYYSNRSYSSGIYPVKPKDFERQIMVLSKYYDFVGQKEICNWIKNGETPEGNFCLITFDDGLKEQMCAYKWLIKENVPAIFYAAAKPLVEKTVLDVHKLQLIRTRVSDGELLKRVNKYCDINFTTETLQKAKTQYRYDKIESQKLKYCLNFMISENQKVEIIKNYFERTFGSEESFCDSFYMNKEDIREISDSNMLGNHGYGHYPLATLSEMAYKMDINDSTSYFQAITQNKLSSFSYPYGSKSAVNSRVASHLKELNYDFGLTMNRGWNHDFNMPYLLKRIDTNDAPGGKNNLHNYVPTNS